MKGKTALEQEAMEPFAAEAKIGLLATINPQGLPHITFISSIRAKTPTELIWGQFTEGMSKRHVKENPHTGFLVLTTDKRMWRGQALWTHEEHQGEDYEMYNNTPMFRYNAYLGIHTVHHMDIVNTYGEESLPMGRIVTGSILTKLAKSGARTGLTDPVLKPWSEDLFNSLSALKFLSHVDENGFPKLIPVIQCQAADSRRLAFSSTAYAGEISNLIPETKIALFGLTMSMENVLIRGTFRGFERKRGVKMGVVDIDWVYNSMPPKQGQIYPEVALEPVMEF
jgi:hypothetical protein